jgi:O-antigen/teichoic acid export membrane protein
VPDTARPASAQPVDDRAPSHLERSVRVGVAWRFAGLAAGQTTRLVTVAILARLLTPDDYGAAAIAVALAAFATTLGDMGMGSALVQTEHTTRTIRATAFWGAIASGLALSVLFVVAAVPVGRFLNDARIEPLVAVGGLTFAIYSVGSIQQAMFVRAMNFRAVELRYAFSLVIASGVAIAAAVGGLGPWALVLQQTTLMTVFVVTLWSKADWHPTWEFSRVDFRRLGGFALRIAGGRWARLAELIVLSLLVGRLVGVADLGVWTFAMSTVILPLTIIAIPIMEVLFSAFSRMRGERERIAALWIQGIGILAAVILPLLVGFVVVAGDVVPLVFGNQWDVAVPVMQILSIYVIVRCLQSWNSIILDAAGKPHITFWTQLAALCLTPIAVVIGAHWGIEAVAAFFVLGQLLAVEIPSLIAVLSELEERASRVAARLSRVAAATAVMAVVCLVGRTGMSELGAGPALRAAATIAVGAVVYPAALYLFAPDIPRHALGLLRRALRRGSA